jgi:hypothetical protein
MSLKIIKKMGEANVTAQRHFIATTFYRQTLFGRHVLENIRITLNI